MAIKEAGCKEKTGKKKEQAEHESLACFLSNLIEKISYFEQNNEITLQIFGVVNI